MRFAPLVLAVVALAAPARSDDVAPELEGADLRAKAQQELKGQLGRLDPSEQKRLVGTYVAFDPNVSAPQAQIACDDDGDHVIVLTDAMLRLVANVARADASDEVNGTKRVEDYANLIVRSQVTGRRLLPLPPGLYTSTKPIPFEARFGDLLAFVIADELARLRAGDHACPAPTATKESGDDVWTSGEQSHAADVGQTVYPAAQEARDEEAFTRILQAGRSERGGLALLRFFVAYEVSYEVESRVAVGRFIPAYTTIHSSPTVRFANAKRIVDARKAQPL